MAEGTNKRAHRVAHTLQQALSALLVEGLRDPRIGLVTITEVRMTDDLRSARVYVSAFGDDEARAASLAGLAAAATYLRRQVSASLRLRFAPMLHFMADETLLHARRLDELLFAASHGQTEPPCQAAADQAPPKVSVPRQGSVTMAVTLLGKGAPDSPQHRETVPAVAGEGTTTPLAKRLQSLRHAALAAGRDLPGRRPARSTKEGSAKGRKTSRLRPTSGRGKGTRNG